MRAFLAIPTDAAWSESTARFTAPLRTSLPAASWTRAEAWHLTLRFFADLSPEAVDRFVDAVAPAAAASAAGELDPGGGLAFPDPRRARVLGIGFRPGAAMESLLSLARAAERAARRAGAPAEERPFRAHVTLARLRQPWPRGAVDRFLEAAVAWPFPAWKLERCVLFESQLLPEGARHTPLHAFALARSTAEAPA